jgi:hypothetical protein
MYGGATIQNEQIHSQNFSNACEGVAAYLTFCKSKIIGEDSFHSLDHYCF